jgi:hypothetical protein
MMREEWERTRTAAEGVKRGKVVAGGSESGTAVAATRREREDENRSCC